jgi:hypothetical protein
VFDQNLNKIKAKDISLNASSINPEVADSTVLPKGWVGTQAYLVNAEVNGTPEKVILVPYADAGQTGGEITTWIKKKI